MVFKTTEWLRSPKDINEEKMTKPRENFKRVENYEMLFFVNILLLLFSPPSPLNLFDRKSDKTVLSLACVCLDPESNISLLFFSDVQYPPWKMC